MLRALLAFCCFAIAAHAEETFGTLKVGTNTFKNARIIQASPVDLLLGHDDGYKRIKLQDLPEDLKAKYPYDAQKAADYEKAEAQKRQLVQAQNAGAARTALLAKEGQLRAQIAAREKDLRRISKDIGTQDRRTKGKGVRSADRQYADDLRRQKIQIRDEMWRMKDELERIEVQRRKYE
ncbi:MAG TPA: hypothetical protein VJ063_12480 [Verrucomicrobiae bacterium]|nr:hypothetical protein [Verrucomicrobiae bacterium]